MMIWSDQEDKLLEKQLEEELKDNFLVSHIDKKALKERARNIIISNRIKKSIMNNDRCREILTLLEIPNVYSIVSGKELIDFLLDEDKFVILSSKLKNKMFW